MQNYTKYAAFEFLQRHYNKQTTKKIEGGAMKTYLKYMFVFSIMLAINLSVQAKDEFTKVIRESFSLRKNTKIDISNKYGDVTIKDWEQQTIKITVTITVEARNLEKAELVFEKIRINFSNSDELVSAATEIISSINNTDFTIDYEVFMPKNQRLKLENKYGGVFINELTNIVDISVKYGSLKVNKLTNGNTETKSEVYLAYSNGYIDQCNWLKLKSSYSKVEIEKAYALMVVSKYSKLEIGNTNSIVANSSYDTPFRVKQASNIVILEGKYSSYDFDQIDRKLELNMKYSDCDVNKLGADFELVKVQLKYGNMDIEVQEGTSYQLKGQAEYGNINAPDSDNMSVFREKYSSRIEGIVGNNKNTKSQILLVSRYGDINLD